MMTSVEKGGFQLVARAHSRDASLTTTCSVLMGNGKVSAPVVALGATLVSHTMVYGVIIVQCGSGRGESD